MVKVCVIHPIEGYWLNFGPLENTFSLRAQMDEKFKNIVQRLLFGTIDFDFVSESLLPTQLESADTKLKVVVMEYDAVVIPSCFTMRRTTLDILYAFKKSGGTVVFAGECPRYIDAVLCDDAKKLYDDSISVPYDKISVQSK